MNHIETAIMIVRSSGPVTREQIANEIAYTTMNTYQRQLLDKLIAELTATASPNLHAAQMIAAELKGAMQVTCEHCDTPLFTQPEYPTPDADGWVENTGVMPECRIVALRWSDGSIMDVANDKRWKWDMKSTTHSEKFAITHYKPA